MSVILFYILVVIDLIMELPDTAKTVWQKENKPGYADEPD